MLVPMKLRAPRGAARGGGGRRPAPPKNETSLAREHKECQFLYEAWTVLSRAAGADAGRGSRGDRARALPTATAKPIAARALAAAALAAAARALATATSITLAA